MSAQILILKKNKLDASEDVVAITASEAQDFVNFVRNRNNTSSWITTGSVDANNTTFIVDFVNLVDIDCISLVKHNFKSYKIEYWDGGSYQPFVTPIDIAVNALPTTIHEFTKVGTTKIKLTIRGTIVADDEKYLYQLIASEKLGNGRLNGWPTIKSPTFSRIKQTVQMLSGKKAIKEQVGFFSCDLEVKVYSDAGDLDVFEKMYLSNGGFLVLLSGGDETQFSSRRVGYRNEDWFLVKCSDEYTTAWYKGYYFSGQEVQIKLAEVTD